MPNIKNPRDENRVNVPTDRPKVKFEVYGREMVEKTVKLSGNSGRVYLPPLWAGCFVKIIRID